MTVTRRVRDTLKNSSPRPGESYPVRTVLGYLEASEDDAARLGLETSPASLAAEEESDSLPAGQSNGSQKRVQPTVRGLPVPANASGASYMSPRMKARMIELGLHAVDLAGLPGSGAAGRVTIQDFEKFVANLEKCQLNQASTMRVAVADAMRRSWSRPLATVALPVCFDALLKHRKACNPKPGPALYALRALSVALSENSAPAGRLIGNQIVLPSAIDVGFAVEAEDGVLVPVLRNVDQKPLKELVARYDELIKLAHQRKLPVEATGGSIATVTNFGTFGLTWATSVTLPRADDLVLGMGAAQRIPHWDEVEGASSLLYLEANVTLSFDHRVLDGSAASRLLAHASPSCSAHRNTRKL